MKTIDITRRRKHKIDINVGDLLHSWIGKFDLVISIDDQGKIFTESGGGYYQQLMAKDWYEFWWSFC